MNIVETPQLEGNIALFGYREVSTTLFGAIVKVSFGNLVLAFGSRTKQPICKKIIATA